MRPRLLPLPLLVVPLLLFAQAPTASGGLGIDLDGDGMSDVWETRFLGDSTNPTRDQDGDGQDNVAESLAGTDPTNPSDTFATHTASFDQQANNYILEWPTTLDKHYRVERSTDLTTWSTEPTVYAGDGNLARVSIGISLAELSASFFRIRATDIDQDSDGLLAYEERLLGFSDNNRNSASTQRTDYEEAVRLMSGNMVYTVDNRAVQGRLPTMEESARFLIQAGMGADYELIQQVSQTGFSAWIESEFSKTPNYHLPRVLDFLFTEQEENGETVHISNFMWSWWDINMRGQDMLRQRVAYALSQILVVSMVGSDELEDSPWGLADYYDILVRNAFGNYKDILYEVTYHPVMGLYLSHAKNRKADPATNRFPDENYAREIMQLFSIGLYELNQDGTRKKDSNGRDTPTYDNADIREFARVFTGLTYDGSHVPRVPWGLDPGDDATIYDEFDFLDADAFFNNPMQAYEPVHDTGPKQLLSYTTVNGTSVSGKIPGGKNTDADIRAAIDNIFNHPNVGPFLAKLLIQRMVKSNPSPDYVKRVALAFNDNGLGVRGDMKSVIRAILLDPEARNRGFLNDPTNGRLREPYMRYLHFCRAFNLTTSNNFYQNNSEDAQLAFQQTPLAAPSVFNFYLPNHSPLGPINDAGLVAPEFAITTASTAVATMNFWVQGAFYLWPMDLEEVNGEIDIQFDLTTEYALMATDPNALIDRLDMILTYGSTSDNSKSVILNAINQADDADLDIEEQVHLALYLFVNSPDFAVLR